MSQVQRRRRRALGVVAVVAALVGGAVGSDAGDDSPSAPAEAGFCDEVSRLRAAGQGLMVRMGARATPDLMQRARRGEIGGVVLFPPPAISGERLSAEIERLQEAAIAGGNPRLLVAIDQEGGAVERLPALAPQISPFTIAQNDDQDNALLEGRATGFQLRELGIDVNLAPVLDVPDSEDHFMAPRA